MKVTIEINPPRWSTRARLRRLPALLLVTALVFAGPVLASDRFDDVPDSNVHHDDISLIAEAGITRGCNTEQTLYCPSQVVTRDQMASFVARTAGLGDNPPVANADELDGLDATAFVQPLFAWIEGSDGTLINGRGVLSSAPPARSGTGRYTINFDGTSIDDSCGFAATVAADTPGGPDSGITGQITVRQGNFLNSVSVETFDSTGAAADRSFFLLAMC